MFHSRMKKLLTLLRNVDNIVDNRTYRFSSCRHENIILFIYLYNLTGREQLCGSSDLCGTVPYPTNCALLLLAS